MGKPEKKLTIIGGGIAGAMEAYFAYVEAKRNGQQIRITIHEKNEAISETTACRIMPSLTPDEILSVVPRGSELLEKLNILFSEPGGIRVNDVENINNSENAEKFRLQALKYSHDESGHQLRTEILLELGRKSMDLWQEIYETGDFELKQILEESNFNPCRELKNPNDIALHNGYRIDLIYDVPNAKNKAQNMIKAYESLGYSHCTILSPVEVKIIDPFLTHFCETHAQIGQYGVYEWKDNAVALYRPGGCIDTRIFLPKFYDYLRKVFGKYEGEDGQLKDCLQLRLGRNVVKVNYDDKDKFVISHLSFFGHDRVLKNKKHVYSESLYVFCPGESIGTLEKLGFNEPTYSGFAGASLVLNISVPEDKKVIYSQLNHCMEVHKEGVVLAWQARYIDEKIFIGVGGTKAFYAKQKPNNSHEFANNRHLLQLNMINDVLPEIISFALDRNTKGQELTKEDLIFLESNKIAVRWVGRRAVPYDGFPTWGAVYKDNSKVKNARCTTHLGAGGISFAPVAALVSQSSVKEEADLNGLSVNKILEFGSSCRGWIPKARL